PRAWPPCDRRCLPLRARRRGARHGARLRSRGHRHQNRASPPGRERQGISGRQRATDPVEREIRAGESMIAVTHILFLSGGNGRNAISGAERHILTLVQELASRGVDTELVVLLWNNDSQIEMALAKVRACGVRVWLIE